MSKVEDTIKLFDIYGSYFNLRINNQAKFKSVLGGTLSILTMGILIFCILNFGQNFFYKKNPIVSIKDSFFLDAEIPVVSGDQYPDTYIYFTFPNFIENILFPVLTTFIGPDQFLYLLQKADNQTLFDNGIIDNTTQSMLELRNYYSFKLNDHKMGANSYATIPNNMPLYVELYDCPSLDPDFISSNNMTCNNTYLTNNTFTQFRVDVIYDKIGFNPEIDYPFPSKKSLYSFNVFNNQINTMKVPFEKISLADDRGIVSPEIINHDLYSVLDFEPFVMAIGHNYHYPLTTIAFYVSDNFRIYSRTYEKLQDLLAAIGGFMKIIFTALNIFNFIIRSYLIDMHIIDTLFRKEEAESEFYQSLKGNISVDTIKSSIYYYLSSLENKINNFLGDINSAVKESKLKIVNNNGKAYNTTDKSQTEKKKESCCRRTVSYFSAVFHNIFNKKFSNDTKKGEKMEVLRNKLVVADRIRDFNYIAEKMNELDVMKGMMLNEHQSLCLKFLKKPSYVEVSDISKTFSTMANSNEENIEIVCNYFIRLLNEDPLSGYDEFLFKNLDDKVRDRILMKLSNIN